MRLPGTRYQEHGWEQVRKLLGQCSLHAFAECEPARLLDPACRDHMLALYVDTMAETLRACGGSARAEAAGNSYGDSVLELAVSLVCELQAHPADWSAFAAAIAHEHAKLGAFWQGAGGDAILRKKVNDMFAGLRDKVDADNYQAACGRSCSPNKIYTYRMLDTAYSDIARIFDSWQEHSAQVAAILGRPAGAVPIEVRQMKSIGGCKAEWIVRWSESLEQFSGSPGPLHTRSKRFASLKNSPDKIQAMLLEIGDYEELSANRDNDWLHDAGAADEWLEDYWRVLCESEQADTAGPDQLLGEEHDEFAAHAAPGPTPAEPEDEPRALDIAAGVSLPPRYMQLARAAQDTASWTARTLDGESLPVRLAVYLKMLGGADDSYPGEWLDPATGALPTMQQLAALDQLSLPTLRKRRDAAIARLMAASRPYRRTI
jgi:hypothetical protein